MAMYSNFHHSNHPNMKHPYQNNGGSGSSGGFPGQQSMSQSNNTSNTLWMGNIDATMDENAIIYAFNAMGVNVFNVKIIRNKENGLPLGYGFVSFTDRTTAQDVLRELNGKKMPPFEDDKRFFLKRANRTNNNGGNGGRFSIFVGNLPPEIDNEVLMQAFGACYPSVTSAKVIMSEGISKGFGFVSFNDEYDYYSALNQPNMMLGSIPILVSKARQSQQGSQGNQNGSGTAGGSLGNGRFQSRGGGDNNQREFRPRRHM